MASKIGQGQCYPQQQGLAGRLSNPSETSLGPQALPTKRGLSSGTHGLGLWDIDDKIKNIFFCIGRPSRDDFGK